MPIPPKPSKYTCKNCGYSVVRIYRSDCFAENDLAPIKCPKCKASFNWEYSKANKFEILLAKLKGIN